MRRSIVRWLIALTVLAILLGGGAPRLFVRSAHAAGSHTSLARPTFATAPSPSGAGNLFPLNPSLDAAVQSAGTPLTPVSIA